MGCDCGAKSSIEEKLFEFFNELIICQISIYEYKKKLLEFIQQDKLSDILLLENEFLNPFFETKTKTHALINHSFTKFIFKVKDKNLPFFLLSLAFQSNTIDFTSLKNNYKIILYEILPENLTKRIKAQNELVVFKNFLIYYFKLISSIVVEAYSQSFTSEEDKLKSDYLKIVYNKAFINVLIKRMFQEENEIDFNLENFISKWYDELKHNKVRENLHEIYMTSKNLTLIDETSFTDFNDIVEETYNIDISDLEFIKVSNINSIKTGFILEFIKVTKINSVARGFLYRKFYKKIKPELEIQTKRIHDNIRSNFTFARIINTEEKRKIFY